MYNTKKNLYIKINSNGFIQVYIFRKSVMHDTKKNL